MSRFLQIFFLSHLSYTFVRMAMSTSLAHTLAAYKFKFEIKKGWAETRGLKIRDDCVEAIRSFPSNNRKQSIEFKYPRVYVEGDCAIGVFVHKRDPSGTTVVTESWKEIVEWGIDANHLTTGTSDEGWRLNLESGVQLCMWEPKVVDPWSMCSLPKTYDINPALTLATCLEILCCPKKATESSASLATSPPSAPGPGTTPAVSLDKDIIPDAPRAVPSWTGKSFKQEDCLPAINAMDVHAMMSIAKGILMKYPQIYGSESCTFGLYFTFPPPDGKGGEVDPRGMSLQQEALRLFTMIAARTGHGGFIDMTNGLQLVVYQKEFVDPKQVCWLVSRISLRACLNNMVAYKIDKELGMD